MKKSFARIAILMAVVCCMPAGRLTAAGNAAGGSSADVSADNLSQLAAELAEKAKQLDQLQRSLEEKSTSSADEAEGTTFRWVGDLGDESGTQQNEDSRQQLEVSVVQPPQIAPRPAALAYLGEASAQAAKTKSNIVFAQASEDIFDSAESLSGTESISETAASSQNDAAWNDSYCGGGCCDACCGGNCDACCGGGCCCPRCCCRPCTIVAGTEAVFLVPEINGNRVNYLYDAAPFGASAFSYQFGPFWGDAAVDDFYVAPRLWLGVQGCRWGVIGRYFHMRVGENDFDRDPGGTYLDQAFNVSSVFEAYCTDLEVTRNFCLHGCKSQLSFGARYAAINFDEQLYARSIVQGVDPNGLSGILDGGARSNRYARGTGLTFGLNGRKPLFCNSCGSLVLQRSLFGSVGLCSQRRRNQSLCTRYSKRRNHRRLCCLDR